eukprot:scaffold51459_cov62-Phaeocystis_antarctica.AAC.6
MVRPLVQHGWHGWQAPSNASLAPRLAGLRATRGGLASARGRCSHPRSTLGRVIGKADLWPRPLAPTFAGR